METRARFFFCLSEFYKHFIKEMFALPNLLYLTTCASLLCAEIYRYGVGPIVMSLRATKIHRKPGVGSSLWARLCSRPPSNAPVSACATNWKPPWNKILFSWHLLSFTINCEKLLLQLLKPQTPAPEKQKQNQEKKNLHVKIGYILGGTFNSLTNTTVSCHLVLKTKNET